MESSQVDEFHPPFSPLQINQFNLPVSRTVIRRLIDQQLCNYALDDDIHPSFLPSHGNSIGYKRTSDLFCRQNI